MERCKVKKEIKLNGQKFFYISIVILILTLVFIIPVRYVILSNISLDIEGTQTIKFLIVVLSMWACFLYFKVMRDNLAYYFSLVFLCYAIECFANIILIHRGGKYGSSNAYLDGYISIGYLVKGFIVLKACFDENEFKKQYVSEIAFIIVAAIAALFTDIFFIYDYFMRIPYSKYFVICFSIIAFYIVTFMALSERLRKDTNILHGLFIVVFMLLNIRKIFTIFSWFHYNLLDFWGEIFLIIAALLPVIGVVYEFKNKIVSSSKNKIWMRNVNYVLDKDKFMTIMIADENKNIKYLNNAARENGVTEGENIIESLSNYIGTYMKEEIYDNLNKNGYWNKKVFNKSGQNLIVTISQLKDDNDKNIYYCTINILVEDKYNCIEKIIDSGSLLSLHKNIKDIVFLLDSKYVIQYVSPSIESIMGYNSSEIISTNMLSLVHPEEITIFKSLNKSTNEDIFLNHRLRKNDGCYLMAEAHIGLKYDEKNNLVNIVLSYRANHI